MKLSFKLSDFEGPLDLLLYLISKHKLNILDVEISELLAQYILFIESRPDKDLEVASEFLEMAARLVHIKTVMLLPKREEEADQLKNRLTTELMEYHLCKSAALKLMKMSIENRVYVRKPMKIDVDLTYNQTHSSMILFDAIRISTGRIVRKRPPSEEPFVPLVKKRVVSVDSRILYLLSLLYKENKIDFNTVFGSSIDRSELVATFLAVLELIKSKRIYISEDTKHIVFTNDIRKMQEVME